MFWNILVASFGKPEIGICISLLVSKLVLLVEFHEVGCCMACVSSVALTVMDDGMLAVSAGVGVVTISICTLVAMLFSFFSVFICFLSFYILCAYFFIHIYPSVLLSANCMIFTLDWMKMFGVYA